MVRKYGNRKQRVKFGKVFRCKKGKYKGKLVKYSYRGGLKSNKKMILHRRRRY